MSGLEQNLALDDEVRRSIDLINNGLAELQQIDGGNDQYHRPMLLLAQGFEHLMKVVICLHHKRQTGQFPHRDCFPEGVEGHNLIWLLDDIAKTLLDDAYLQKCPRIATDVRDFRSNKRLRKILEVLSMFGKGGRYHDLNVILGSTKGLDPKALWEEEVEDVFVKDDPNWLAKWKDWKRTNQNYAELNSKIVAVLERFARGLCRLFTMGDLGQPAFRQTGVIAPFLFLRDEDLGTKVYRIHS